MLYDIATKINIQYINCAATTTTTIISKKLEFAIKMSSQCQVLLTIFSPSFALFRLDIINSMVHSPNFCRIRTVLSTLIYICYALTDLLCLQVSLSLSLIFFALKVEQHFMFPNLSFRSYIMNVYV